MFNKATVYSALPVIAVDRIYGMTLYDIRGNGPLTSSVS